MKKDVTKKCLLEQLRKTPVVQIACEKIGVGRASYYRWKQDDTQFAQAADVALQEGLQLMNDMAESQLLSAIKDKNITAIIFWLKHHHASYTTRLEISGQLTHLNEELTPAQEAIIKAALRLAAFPQRNNDSKTPNEHRRDLRSNEER